MGKKRILHLTSSLKMGGAEQVLFQQLRFLQDDFEHYVIYFHSGPFVEKIKALGISVYHVPYGPLFFIRLYRLVKKIDPSVIHSLLWIANFTGRIIARFLDKPIICAIHSPCNTNVGMSKIRRICDQLTMKWASYVVFVSKDIDVKNMGARASQVKQIDNGIDFRWLQACALEKKRVGKKGVIIGSVGRLVPIKNQTFLLKVLKKLNQDIPDIQLIIVGDGPLREQLLMQARALNIEQHVKIIADEALLYYSCFDLFVLPSHAEGLSMALLEAMSFGIPSFVASDSGTHDVITHGVNGFLFDNRDEGRFVWNVKNLLTDRKKKNEICEHAKKNIADCFSIEKMGNAYKSLYDELSLF
jgi:glycosyltransferase involved in cell wall biosynthesis